MTTLDFIRDRDEALLSLDRQKIEAYLTKYGSPIPPDDQIFWAGIHKARTAIKSISDEERQKSIDWLKARGLTSLE